MVWDTIDRFLRSIIVFAALIAQVGGWLAWPNLICKQRAG
jgi:hypothetical protein